MEHAVTRRDKKEGVKGGQPFAALRKEGSTTDIVNENAPPDEEGRLFPFDQYGFWGKNPMLAAALTDNAGNPT